MNTQANEVNLSFLETARRALKKSNVGAIEFLGNNPAASKAELAKRLGHGVSAIGLTMAIYEEARRVGRTRDVAKELLFRMINEEFPAGWQENEKVHSSVKLGAWDYDILSYVPDLARHSSAILKELTQVDPPPVGWTPADASDERLVRLFDKCWPNASDSTVA